MQVLSKILPQNQLFTDIARRLFISMSNIARSRALPKSGLNGSVFLSDALLVNFARKYNFLSKTKIKTNLIYTAF